MNKRFSTFVVLFLPVISCVAKRLSSRTSYLIDGLIAQPIAYKSNYRNNPISKQKDFNGLNFERQILNFPNFSGKKMVEKNNISVSRKTVS